MRQSFPAWDGTWLVPCLGATSGLGRLVFGRIADMPRFNKIALQQVSADDGMAESICVQCLLLCVVFGSMVPRIYIT